MWLSLVDDTETALVLVLRELIGPGADPLEVRLLAIAANTAQRMAVAAWVDGESPAYGDGSPAEVAVRCIRILTAGLGARVDLNAADLVAFILIGAVKN